LGALRVHQAAPLTTRWENLDQPPQTVQRYLVEKQRATHFEWRFNNNATVCREEKKLRLVVPVPAQVHWTFDGWQLRRTRILVTR